MRQLKRITVDPRVMGGKPCIRNMRVTVGTIVGLIGAGRTPEDVLEAYPYLEREDIFPGETCIPIATLIPADHTFLGCS